jgi:hypothetical protein
MQSLGYNFVNASKAIDARSGLLGGVAKDIEGANHKKH